MFVRFGREGPLDGVELDPQRVYQVSVDGGPRSEFRSPWTRAELEVAIASLRNKADGPPDIASMRGIGRKLGTEFERIVGLPARLVDGATLYLQLDYPELARLPWELVTSSQPPYPHLLMQNMSIVRTVPAAIPNPPAAWPTGRNERLRLLFVWGEADASVPHDEHQALLERVCTDNGIELVSAECIDIASLAKLCADTQANFVHILAHGADDGNDEWGLRLRSGVAKGEQVARALISSRTMPALVTISACDSANEQNNTFGSVAYQLHVYGVPLVLASQFRLRKTVSVTSVEAVYAGIFGGDQPYAIIEGLRRQLAPRDDEAWANEVLYSRYRHESLIELGTVARQQAALRRARRVTNNPPADTQQAIALLRAEAARLVELVKRLEDDGSPATDIAETFGLLGSMRRRIARIRQSPPDEEDLRAALAEYERGIRADANSHYCGINVVHIALLIGDRARAATYLPIVRFVAGNAAARGDFWASATAGEIEVYAGDDAGAAEHYRSFVRAVEDLPVRAQKRDLFESSLTQLRSIIDTFPEGDGKVKQAARKSVAVLQSAIERL